eukprot:9345446-Pyramimonas_sp.AAC.1
MGLNALVYQCYVPPKNKYVKKVNSGTSATERRGHAPVEGDVLCHRLAHEEGHGDLAFRPRQLALHLPHVGHHLATPAL